MINIVLRSKEEELLIENCKKLAVQVRAQFENNNAKTVITGPMAMPIPKLRNNFRWGMIIQTEDVGNACRILRTVIKQNRMPGKIKTAVDVDPRMVI